MLLFDELKNFNNYLTVYIKIVNVLILLLTAQFRFLVFPRIQSNSVDGRHMTMHTYQGGVYHQFLH